MYAYAQSKVEICGVNTAKLQTLKNDEMRELLDRSHHGDKDARDKLICGNLRLVLSVIQRFTSRGENPDDLFQVGCIGLIKAIDNFDPSHEVMFSTYGVPMISGEVKTLSARQQRRARQPFHARHGVPRHADQRAADERKR